MFDDVRVGIVFTGLPQRPDPLFTRAPARGMGQNPLIKGLTMAHSNIPKQQKRETMRRLVDEGRWEDACRRREALRGGGMTADEAWLQMEEEYPPVEEPEPTVEDTAEAEAYKVEVAELIARTEGMKTSILDEMRWALSKAGEKIRPSEAPSAGAFSLWKWSQDDLRHFMAFAIPKLLARETEQQREKQQQKDQGIPELERLIADLEEREGA